MQWDAVPLRFSYDCVICKYYWSYVSLKFPMDISWNGHQKPNLIYDKNLHNKQLILIVLLS